MIDKALRISYPEREPYTKGRKDHPDGQPVRAA